MYIKPFASKYQLSVDTIRFYEKEGILNPKRLVNGYRFYDEQCEKHIKLILVFKELGFSLQEIRTLILLEKQPWTEECNTNTSDLFANKRTAIQKKVEFFTFALQSLQIAEDLVRAGKYEENKENIEKAIDEMYSKINHEVD